MRRENERAKFPSPGGIFGEWWLAVGDAAAAVARVRSRGRCRGRRRQRGRDETLEYFGYLCLTDIGRPWPTRARENRSESDLGGVSMEAHSSSSSRTPRINHYAQR